MNDPASVHPEEARLLLYLAGELSPQERRSLEAVLADDPALRQQLDALRRVEASMNHALSAADAAEPVEGRLPSIERRVSSALAQWQVDRLTRSEQSVARTRFRRVPVWMYPLSAAAIVMVGLGLWWLSLETLPDGMVARTTNPPQFEQGGRGFVGDPDGPFDLALNDLGSESFSDLERDLAQFRALNETLQ